MRSKDCASRSGEIALVGSPRLRATLAAAAVLFAHIVVTETEIGRIISATVHLQEAGL